MRMRAKRAVVRSQKSRPFAHLITPTPGVLATPDRAARPGPSLRKRSLLRMTKKLDHYCWSVR